MTGRLPDRWTQRDLPVLVEIATAIDSDTKPDFANIATSLGITPREADRARSALTRAGYINDEPYGIAGHPPLGYELVITERGMRAVGLWPSGEGVDALVDALRQAEDTVDDPEEKTLIRRAAGAVGSVSRDVMVDVMAAVIARQSGVG